MPLKANSPALMCRVTPQDHAMIREQARRRGIAVSQFIRNALEAFIHADEPDAPSLYLPQPSVPVPPLARRASGHRNPKADIRPIDERPHKPQSQASFVEQATYAHVQTSVGMDTGLLLREPPRARRR